MAKKTLTEKWAVIEYTDGLCACCHISDVNKQDERVELVSEHNTLEEAQKARDAYGKKNKLTIQK